LSGQRHELSGQLQAIGLHFRQELPTGAKSLLLKNDGGRISIEVYDNSGKVVGTVPNQTIELRNALEATFAHAVSPDPVGVIAIL
jgi:hypothetical protein